MTVKFLEKSKGRKEPAFPLARVKCELASAREAECYTPTLGHIQGGSQQGAGRTVPPLGVPSPFQKMLQD